MNNALHCPSLCSASKTATGEALKLHDAEMKILASGPMGMQRLATMRALDLQENIPGLSNEDAQKMGAGYVMLKVLGVNGSLTVSTRSEVQRLEAKE
ncbi:hypothetical protein V5H21_06615 [Vibrio cholerae]|uniref:hypothetical protein n=1 Tax=Vibrio cholerae TaxID=666 RepID=UPI001EC7F5CB|nr:hypothetical protein [Vibrio cholerae]EGR0770867.1 hypothetical protein [Vibrio parahaemolyticus]EGR0840479.1 hypothetical protein [Vibrio parahaemolyticus]MCR9698978.1 hypothetical protein [Vibrio cholerae]HDZ9250767.1 hypothetical protein [Vibrio cholerae]